MSLSSRVSKLRNILLAMAMLGATMCASAQQARANPATAAASTGDEIAIFGGGCFWCMEPPYDKLPGVKSTVSGYIGGSVDNPTYEQVSAGGTGHVEVLEVTYDPRKISYEKLLEVFWRNIDPFAVNRQFCDVGDQYRSAIFTIGPEQARLADSSKRKLQASGGAFKQPIATEILVATEFYPAEDYHQDYYLKNPVRYKYYRFSCGRDQRLKQIWGAAAK